MIGYLTLGTNRYDEAAVFYDALLAEIGAKRLMRGMASSPGAPAWARHHEHSVDEL
ncbi:hypothetical protein [Maricaulis sp.]|uniref:hypothetical protein n=1 Tax=Maricaulis sp. TaxID=1486257 RepID=UPI003A94A603